MIINPTSGGSGDVIGPAGATDGAVASFDGVTGLLLKDSGFLASAGALSSVASLTFTGGGVVSSLAVGNYRFNNTSGRGLLLDTTIFTSLATYRTWSFPVNANDTFVGAVAAQTLTNKTLTDPVFAGSTKFKGFTTSTSSATTAELPDDKDFSIHKNSDSSVVTLAFNDGGTIKVTALA